jgi:N-acyl-D-amino-acid deacylase
MNRKNLILGIALLLANTLDAQDYDLVIRNGRIVDGTGNSWYRGDLAIKGGKIAAIGTVTGKG